MAKMQELMADNVTEIVDNDIQPNVEDTSVEDITTPTIDGEATEPTEAPASPPAEEKETQSVPLPIYMDLKHELRDLKQQIAVMTAPVPSTPKDLVPDTPVEAPQVAPSPMDTYVQEYIKRAAEQGESVLPQDVPISYGIMQQQQQWEKMQTQQMQSLQAKQAREHAMNAAAVKYSDAQMGQGLGFQTIITQGNAFLTEGDRLDIANAGAGCAEVAYERCFDRLVKSGTPQGIAIQQLADARMAALRGKSTVPATPAVPDVTQKPATTANPKNTPPTTEEVLQRRPPIFNQIGIEWPG